MLNFNLLEKNNFINTSQGIKLSYDDSFFNYDYSRLLFFSHT